MFKLIRDEDGMQGWQGPEGIQVLLANGRIHFIHGFTLNVSIPESALEFHAGTKEGLAYAVSALLAACGNVQAQETKADKFIRLSVIAQGMEKVPEKLVNEMKETLK